MNEKMHFCLNRLECSEDELELLIGEASLGFLWLAHPIGN